MATFIVKAHTKVEKWQDVTYEVEADTPEEAKEKIKKHPLSTATGYDNLDEDDEKVIEIDFENSGNGEDITLI